MHVKNCIVLSLCCFASMSFAAEKKVTPYRNSAAATAQVTTELRSRDAIHQLWARQTKQIEQDGAFQTDITERLKRMEEGISTIKASQSALQGQQIGAPMSMKRLFCVVLTAGCLGDCLKGLLF